MSDIDLQDKLSSARHLVNAVLLMADGLGKADGVAALAEVAGILHDQLAEIAEALADRKEARP